MIKAIVFDFSRVLLDVKDKEYSGSLNSHHKQLKQSENYKLFDHFELNEELVNFLEDLKERYDLYVFTTGFMHSEPEIQEKISHIFKKMYNLEDTGLGKDDPKAFKKLASIIGKEPEEILFVDDTKENIESAERAGVQAIQYLNNNQLFADLKLKLK